MSEADERVCVYAVFHTDTWDHLQKGSNDTEMRPCTESYTRVKRNKPKKREESKQYVGGGGGGVETGFWRLK